LLDKSFEGTGTVSTPFKTVHAKLPRASSGTSLFSTFSAAFLPN
jgi:hypothetical protein